MKFLAIQKEPVFSTPETIDAANKLRPAQWEYFKSLKDQGKIEAHYAFAGYVGGATIFNVDTIEELDKIVIESPMYFYHNWDIHPLVPHEKRKSVFQEIMKR